MRYMHIRTFALKMVPSGIDAATLTPAAQTITQLTRWTGGGDSPFLQTQNGTDTRDGHRKTTAPIFTD